MRQTASSRALRELRINKIPIFEREGWLCQPSLSKIGILFSCKSLRTQTQDDFFVKALRCALFHKIGTPLFIVMRIILSPIGVVALRQRFPEPLRGKYHSEHLKVEECDRNHDWDSHWWVGNRKVVQHYTKTATVSS